MLYNTKIIEYDDYIHIQHYGNPIKRVDFDEETQKHFDDFENEAIKTDLDITVHEKDEKKQKHNLKVSQNRAKNNLFRIARSNNWEYFLTLTFDQKRYDSTDYDFVSNCVTKFCSDIRRKFSPDFKYLIVPELHKDGKHYHFHGLITNIGDLDLVFSGKFDRDNNKIFNIPFWEYGFTTASEIKNQSAVRNYIGKYITKELMNNLKYKKRYYASQNVNICEEKYYNYTLNDIYYLFPEISFAKSINIDKVQKINYFEIKKS